MQTSAKTVKDFWLAVQRDAVSGCWTWMGSRLEGAEMRTMCDGRHWVVARLAYTLTYGPLLHSMHLIRACANPRCSNPDHHVVGGSTRPSLTQEEFWARVDKSGGAEACWPYQRRRLAEGYGQIEFDRAVW